jgi:hypothetical protein
MTATDAAAGAFRQILNRSNSYTVASVVGEWPPCRDRFVDTVYYEELQRDFGHLAEN